MKIWILFFFILVFNFNLKLFANSVPQGISIRSNRSVQSPIKKSFEPLPERPAPLKTSIRKKIRTDPLLKEKKSQDQVILSNLPSYYHGIDRSQIRAADGVVVVVPKQSAHLKGLKSGDLVHAVIEQKIKASSSVPTPIRAMAIGGKFPGSFFLGEAVLDHELKRVLLNFSKLRISHADQVYQLKAAGLSSTGEVGLEGHYSSQAGLFFLGQFLSAATGGLLDATISRNQTTMGGYVQEPSLKNAAKSAATTALSQTSERFAEGTRKAPEFTEVSAYQEIQVLIQEDPQEVKI